MIQPGNSIRKAGSLFCLIGNLASAAVIRAERDYHAKSCRQIFRQFNGFLVPKPLCFQSCDGLFSIFLCCFFIICTRLQKIRNACVQSCLQKLRLMGQLWSHVQKTPQCPALFPENLFSVKLHHGLIGFPDFTGRIDLRKRTHISNHLRLHPENLRRELLQIYHTICTRLLSHRSSNSAFRRCCIQKIPLYHSTGIRDSLP